MPSAHATFSVVNPIARVYFCPSYAMFDLLCDSVFATLRLSLIELLRLDPLFHIRTTW